MLHTSHSDWSLATKGASAAVTQYASAEGDAITVSALSSNGLVEPQVAANDASHTVALLTPPPSYRNESPVAGDASGMDTAVLALGMIGFWLMLLGAAMLSRHFRLVKNQNPTLLDSGTAAR